MAADTMRSVGWGLIAIGLLDIGFMVYCIVNQIGYGSSLNLFAVIVGVLLMQHRRDFPVQLFQQWDTARRRPPAGPIGNFMVGAAGL